jgi:hypothetical protein
MIRSQVSNGRITVEDVPVGAPVRHCGFVLCVCVCVCVHLCASGFPLFLRMYISASRRCVVVCRTHSLIVLLGAMYTTGVSGAGFLRNRELPCNHPALLAEAAREHALRRDLESSVRLRGGRSHCAFVPLYCLSSLPLRGHAFCYFLCICSFIVILLNILLHTHGEVLTTC